MKKRQAAAGSVDEIDVWPPVELTMTGVSQEDAIEWAESRIVELKALNLRFIRAMDIAGVDPAELPPGFSRSFDFFGTADGYLTVSLQMLRGGNCGVEQLPSLIKAVTMLADLLSEARNQMLSMMRESMRSDVLDSEAEIESGPEDVEEEMEAIGRMKPGRKSTASARR